MTRTCFLFFISWFCALNSYAEIYKCKDAEGRLLYSDTVCATNLEGQTVAKSSEAAPASPALFTALIVKLKLFFKNFLANPVSNIQTQPASSDASLPNYHCDGRTRCSQMHSCDEATFFINHCPNTEMDGDYDGIPCESQWCL